MKARCLSKDRLRDRYIPQLSLVTRENFQVTIPQTGKLKRNVFHPNSDAPGKFCSLSSTLVLCLPILDCMYSEWHTEISTLNVVQLERNDQFTQICPFFWICSKWKWSTEGKFLVTLPYFFNNTPFSKTDWLHLSMWYFFVPSDDFNCWLKILKFFTLWKILIYLY